MPELLTIGEVAKRSGVAASALRFYEERDLIRSERAGSGHRHYPRPVLRRIAFIVFAQKDRTDPRGDRRPSWTSCRPTRSQSSRLVSPVQRLDVEDRRAGSPSSSASRPGSPSASAAAACRWTAASWPTPTTGRPRAGPVRATGSAIARHSPSREGTRQGTSGAGPVDAGRPRARRGDQRRADPGPSHGHLRHRSPHPLRGTPGPRRPCPLRSWSATSSPARWCPWARTCPTSMPATS